MQVLSLVFGFYLREKVRDIRDLKTIVSLLAGAFVLALYVPALGVLFYLGLAWLSWIVVSRKVTRTSIYFFWLPYFWMVGFGIWNDIFPYGLGIALATLLSFPVSNLFFLLLTKMEFKYRDVLLLPLGFFLFEFLFQRVPYINKMELPLLFGFLVGQLSVIRLALLLGGSLTLFAVVLAVNSVIAAIHRREYRGTAGVMLGAVLIIAVAANMLSARAIGVDGGAVTIAAVQGSTTYDTHSLRGQDYLDAVFERYSGLIRDVTADIFVFPEVPMAIYYPVRKEYDGRQFVELARQKNAVLVPLVSEYRNGDGDEPNRYITSLMVGPEGILGLASKRNLVPFSESRQVRPGSDYSPIATAYGPVGIAICYDFNAPHVLAKLKQNGAQIVFAPFNDTGFGTEFHRMHSHYSILRALEYNLPIIVANEDGISQLVDRDGQVHATIGIGKQGIISAPVLFEHRPSYYFSLGRYLEYTLLILVAVRLISSRIRLTGSASGSC